MKTSLTQRLAAVAASLLMTFGVVQLIAGYALPQAAPAQLAMSGTDAASAAPTAR